MIRGVSRSLFRSSSPRPPSSGVERDQRAATQGSDGGGGGGRVV